MRNLITFSFMLFGYSVCAQYTMIKQVYGVFGGVSSPNTHAKLPQVFHMSDSLHGTLIVDNHLSDSSIVFSVDIYRTSDQWLTYDSLRLNHFNINNHFSTKVDSLVFGIIMTTNNHPLGGGHRYVLRVNTTMNQVDTVYLDSNYYFGPYNNIQFINDSVGMFGVVSTWVTHDYGLHWTKALENFRPLKMHTYNSKAYGYGDSLKRYIFDPYTFELDSVRTVDSIYPLCNCSIGGGIQVGDVQLEFWQGQNGWDLGYQYPKYLGLGLRPEAERDSLFMHLSGPGTVWESETNGEYVFIVSNVGPTIVARSDNLSSWKHLKPINPNASNNYLGEWIIGLEVNEDGSIFFLTRGVDMDHHYIWKGNNIEDIIGDEELHVAVMSLLEKEGLRLGFYPNPTSDFILLNGIADQEGKGVSIYDLDGKNVANEVITNGKIEVQQLNSGTYILVLPGVQALRFVKY